jgi:hypothetical protein
MGGFGQRFLDDVGRIDSSGNAAVEAASDHAPQPVAVPRQQRLPRRPFAAASVLDQDIGIRFLSVHEQIFSHDEY